jgi:hypothetical protein
MRLTLLVIAALAIWLVSCGSEPKQPTATAPRKAEAPKPADESAHLPSANLVRAEVVPKDLLGKTFMPGGTLGHYKKGTTEYEMFIVRMPTALDAAILLPDWNKTLSGSKLVPSFGGYFGEDAGRPVFVFSKNAWIAGVAGLPQKEADVQARILAGRLN